MYHTDLEYFWIFWGILEMITNDWAKGFLSDAFLNC